MAVDLELDAELTQGVAAMTALATPRRSRLRVRLIDPVMPVLRVLRSLLRFAAMTAAGFAIGIGLALALPLAFHARPLVVLSGSMEPTLGTGDVSVVRTHRAARRSSRATS